MTSFLRPCVVSHDQGQRDERSAGQQPMTSHLPCPFDGSGRQYRRPEGPAPKAKFGARCTLPVGQCSAPRTKRQGRNSWVLHSKLAENAGDAMGAAFTRHHRSGGAYGVYFVTPYAVNGRHFPARRLYRSICDFLPKRTAVRSGRRAAARRHHRSDKDARRTLFSEFARPIRGRWPCTIAKAATARSP